MMGVVLPAAASGLLFPGQVRPVPPSYLAVPNGLVGYWGLDPDCLDFTASKAFDLSGNGLTGTLNSLTAASLVNGQVGTGLSFSSSYINLGTPASLDFTGPCSAAAWVYRTGSGIQIFSKGFSGGITQYQMQYDGSSKAQFNTYNGTVHGVTSSSVSIANVWEHWVGVFDGANWKIYKNGNIDATAADSQAPIHTAQNAAIGAIYINGSPGQNWTGYLDDIRAYNRALDPWEVLTLYQAGLAGQRHNLLAMPEYAELSASSMLGQLLAALTAKVQIAARSIAALSANVGLTGRFLTQMKASSSARGATSLSSKSTTMYGGVVALTGSAPLFARCASAVKTKAAASYVAALSCLSFGSVKSKSQTSGSVKLLSVAKTSSYALSSVSAFVPFVAMATISGASVKARAAISFLSNILPVLSRTLKVKR